jgi:hypothetical protein
METTGEEPGATNGACAAVTAQHSGEHAFSFTDGTEVCFEDSGQQM